MNAIKQAVLAIYPNAECVRGDGSNPPDIAIRRNADYDSGLLSGMCNSEEDAWASALEQENVKLREQLEEARTVATSMTNEAIRHKQRADPQTEQRPIASGRHG